MTVVAKGRRVCTLELASIEFANRSWFGMSDCFADLDVDA